MSMDNDLWTPKAQGMFTELCRTLTLHGREGDVSAGESSAALVATCLSFCRAVGIDKEEFAETLKKSSLRVSIQ